MYFFDEGLIVESGIPSWFDCQPLLNIFILILNWQRINVINLLEPQYQHMSYCIQIGKTTFSFPILAYPSALQFPAGGFARGRPGKPPGG